jgi:hypothetical protein
MTLKHGNYICKSEGNYLTYEHRIEIRMEFTYVNHKKMIKNMEITYVNHKKMIKNMRKKSHVNLK